MSCPLTARTALLVLLSAVSGACQGEADPRASHSQEAQAPLELEAAQKAPAPRIWRLAAAVSHPPPPAPGVPSFAEGQDLLGQDCQQAAATLAARPPPCRAELWQAVEASGDGSDDSAIFLRVGKRTLLRLLGQEFRREASWRWLSSPLSDCLGDPLASPPAGDLAGYRLLVSDERDPHWLLQLSGDNTCHLSGSILLPITGKQAGSQSLSVDGAPWREGGSQLARSHLRAHLRSRALEEWPAAEADQRILLLLLLSRDTDPEAGRILSELKRLHPEAADDIDAALLRWAKAQAAASP